MISSKQSKQTYVKIEIIKVNIPSPCYSTIGLISDTLDSVRFLNRLPMSALEESIQVFRANLFSMSDRKLTTRKIF